ncbi:hypothetical protein QQ008_22695 [Fulvivirgaceae bacterium BMA10]|uniref:Nitrogen fixation protein NifH n=1 Tax=Splendidivirga corallicola TaxID=3051826 RepID=A0ABT8KU00_9BACT|nr:hypothetical protein [Fulvivirgaceae bacterium BMA10]
MDAALELKHKIKEQLISTFEEAKPYLDGSTVFQNLLADFEITSLNLLHRLLEISEIPFSYNYKKVQVWRDKLAENTFCGEGFSLSGKKDDLLACYNAMITSVLIILRYENLEQVQQGINWILKYQNIKRNSNNLWKGKGILKYGGCMKSTPCYIGVIKSMISLSEANRKGELRSHELNAKLKNGLEYILEHKVYKRKSADIPITKDITKFTYPFTYKTNLIEILRLLKANDLLNDNRCDESKRFILKKQKEDGFWRVNSFYKPKFWVDFDKPKEKAEWISFEINEMLH